MSEDDFPDPVIPQDSPNEGNTQTLNRTTPPPQFHKHRLISIPQTISPESIDDWRRKLHIPISYNLDNMVERFEELKVKSKSKLPDLIWRVQNCKKESSAGANARSKLMELVRQEEKLWSKCTDMNFGENCRASEFACFYNAHFSSDKLLPRSSESIIKESLLDMDEVGQLGYLALNGYNVECFCYAMGCAMALWVGVISSKRRRVNCTVNFEQELDFIRIMTIAKALELSNPMMEWIYKATRAYYQYLTDDKDHLEQLNHELKRSCMKILNQCGRIFSLITVEVRFPNHNNIALAILKSVGQIERNLPKKK
ncbi:hypothetical protein AKO1_004604 [Acrasis kona]|uniref:Uncharacterized protein n=1 Tax=Acrasis kona TaxID=1008807 RepID=A0AAW2Z5Q8_9EUKA